MWPRRVPRAPCANSTRRGYRTKLPIHQSPKFIFVSVVPNRFPAIAVQCRHCQLYLEAQYNAYLKRCDRPWYSKGYFRFLFDAEGVAAASYAGGAGTGQQCAGCELLALAELLEAGRQVWRGQGRGAWAARAALAPGEHGSPQGPERLRCIGPLYFPPPWNNIAPRRTNAHRGAHTTRSLHTIKLISRWSTYHKAWRHDSQRTMAESISSTCPCLRLSPSARSILSNRHCSLSLAHTLAMSTTLDRSYRVITMISLLSDVPTVW